MKKNLSINENINEQIELAKVLSESKKTYELALDNMENQKYLEAIEIFKEIDKVDMERYKDVENKILECKSKYISMNIDNAKLMAKDKDYESAIELLDVVIAFDSNYKEDIQLKEKYAEGAKKQVLSNYAHIYYDYVQENKDLSTWGDYYDADMADLDNDGVPELIIPFLFKTVIEDELAFKYPYIYEQGGIRVYKYIDNKVAEVDKIQRTVDDIRTSIGGTGWGSNNEDFKLISYENNNYIVISRDEFYVGLDRSNYYTDSWFTMYKLDNKNILKKDKVACITTEHIDGEYSYTYYLDNNEVTKQDYDTFLSKISNPNNWCLHFDIDYMQSISY
mgnify:CR=1 FL=1